MLERRFFPFLVMLALSMHPVLASAHPLGNFTVNHITKVEFRAHDVAVRYVLDLAEIPAFQTEREISPTGKASARQLQAWANTIGDTLISEIELGVDEKRVALHRVRSQVRTRPGAGGLATLYLIADATGPFSRGGRAHTFRIVDTTYGGRLGWHDVVVAPATEPTRELTAYPDAMLGSPRATTTAAGSVAADGRTIASHAVEIPQVQALQSPVAPANSQSQSQSLARSNQLSDMLARGTGDWKFVMLTFVAAIVLGALHAMEPGHGKTLLAISLVGSRATVKQAGILAVALTIAHTIGVLALGVALNLTKGYFVPETIYPWITLISGGVIAIVGARAVSRAIRRGHTTHAHSHAHVLADSTQIEHRHDGLDDAEHALLHAIPGTAPLRFGPTVWAAMSGGVAPCPAALVVLLAAVSLNQVAYGIFVIVAFSFGLAATLTGLGIAVVRGAVWLQGRPQFERFVKAGPFISATLISVIGSVMVGQGFKEQGVATSPLLISGIVMLVIVGYIFSHPFGHSHTELG